MTYKLETDRLITSTDLRQANSMCNNFVDKIISTDLSSLKKAQLIISAHSQYSLEAMIESITFYDNLSESEQTQIQTLQVIYNHSELDPEYDLEFIKTWRNYLIKNSFLCASYRPKGGICIGEWIACYLLPEQMLEWEASSVYDPHYICDLYDEHIYPQDASSCLRWHHAINFDLANYAGYKIGELICKDLLSIQQAKQIIFGKSAE